MGIVILRRETFDRRIKRTPFRRKGKGKKEDAKKEGSVFRPTHRPKCMPFRPTYNNEERGDKKSRPSVAEGAAFILNEVKKAF